MFDLLDLTGLIDFIKAFGESWESIIGILLASYGGLVWVLVLMLYVLSLSFLTEKLEEFNTKIKMVNFLFLNKKNNLLDWKQLRDPGRNQERIIG